MLENSIWLSGKLLRLLLSPFIGGVLRAYATQPQVASCISLLIHLFLKY